MRILLLILLSVISFCSFGQTRLFSKIKVSDSITVNGGMYTQRLRISNPLDSAVSAIVDSAGNVIPSNNPFCAACIWSKDGSQVWLTDSTDNVGIGTTDPTANLHVVGSYKMLYDSVTLTSDVTFYNWNDDPVVGSGFYRVNGLDWQAIGSFYEANDGVMYSGIFGKFGTTKYGSYFDETNDTYTIYAVDTASSNESQLFVDPDNGATVLGSFGIQDGTEANGYVLTSDASGNATWQPKLALDSINCISGTGWASVFDGTTTYTIGAGDTTTLLIAQDAVVDNYAPCGWSVDSFYNSVDSVIIGREGDAYILSLDWLTTQNTNNVTEFKWWINIGGAVGIIYPVTYEQNKGIGVDKQYNKSTWVYTLDTWEANGGKIQFVSDQEIEISNVRLNIQRLYKAE